ncbi:SKP1-like protein 11 [Dioscorea cayenensis subsp. rotundata]|uniref:SKP1-like protein n=1 Tax=Dioscorea cayennensis subsp. rotundata TaxID=55577 RepID=A0AB40B6T4_DIOCR|nr:SKP1-like protein 11 [Dioscorea cayenensis subsp. rotundata]
MKGKATTVYDDKGESSTSRSMKKEQEEEEEEEFKKKMVILKSKDGLEFKVELALIKQSGVLSVVAEEAQEEEEEEVDGEKVLRIPCNEVRGEVLDLMIMYWKEHHDHNDGAIIDENKKKDYYDEAYDQAHLRNWDKEFAGDIEKELFLELLMASNFLDSRKLMNFACQTVAHRIMDLTVEQVREFFEIIGDFTPEEEEELRKDNEWAFD